MIRMVQADHRRFPRSALSRELPASLMVGGRSYNGSVIDYSLQGVGLKVESGALKRAEREDFDIEVKWQNANYYGRIKHSHLQEHSAVLGVDLESVKDQKNVSFTSEDSGWDLIEDKEILKNLFSDLAFKGPEALLDFRQIRGRASLIPLTIRDENVLLAEVFKKNWGRIDSSTAACRFDLFQTSHAFETRVLKIAEKKIELEVPKRVARLLRRETVRVKNGTNDRFLSVEIQSDLLGRSNGSLRLYDYGEHGLSIIDPTGRFAAPKDIVLESITITTPEGIQIRGQGTIRGHRWIASEEDYAIGISFETNFDEDRTAWHNVILEARYPSLSFNYQDEDHKKIWDLFERSDYLHLKGAEAYTHMIDLTKSTWKTLSNAGTKWSKRPMIHLDGNVVGHIQMDQIYPDTWCVHHLAIDPKISKMVAKEIYAVMTDILSAEGGRYVLSFTETSKPWNQRSYYDFVKTYRFPNHNELKTFQVYEADLTKPESLKIQSGIEIKKANKYDLRRIERYFQIYASELERGASALDYEDLEFSSFSKEAEKVGLERTREFLVATLNNEFLGFARLETGSLGVNIVGILDIIYVYVMPNVRISGDNIRETLLKSGMNRFKEYGKEKVFIALDDGRTNFYSQRGLNFVCDANRWIALRDCIPRYHAFTQVLYGHLTLRKEKIRKKHSKN